MTVKQMIKQANMVFAWVMISEEDGAYVQVTKSNLLLVLDKHGYDDHKFSPRDGDLYINQFVNVTKCRGGENRQEFSVPAPATNCRTPAGAKFRGSRFT